VCIGSLRAILVHRRYDRTAGAQVCGFALHLRSRPVFTKDPAGMDAVTYGTRVRALVDGRQIQKNTYGMVIEVFPHPIVVQWFVPLRVVKSTIPVSQIGVLVDAGKEETMAKPYRDVFTVIESNDPQKKAFWLKIGSSFLNKDGSETVLLNALPTNSKLVLREPLKAGQDDASDQPPGQNPPGETTR